MLNLVHLGGVGMGKWKGKVGDRVRPKPGTHSMNMETGEREYVLDGNEGLGGKPLYCQVYTEYLRGN
jgi:hypothetical protein